MIKTAQIIHTSFKNKRLNKYCYDYAISNEKDLSGRDIQVLQLFSKLGVSNQNQLTLASKIFNILSEAYGEVSKDILKKSYDNCCSLEKISAADIYQTTLEACSNHLSFRKVAYPQGDYDYFSNDFSEANMLEWGRLVKEIYNASYSNDLPIDSGIEVVANKLNKRSPGEGDRFAKWVNYYKNGEHLKYSSDKEVVMQKKATYQFGPRGGSTYTQTPDIRGPSAEIYNLFGQEISDKDIGIFESNALDAKNEVDKRTNYKSWKSKLHTAIRRIDKLIRQGEELIDPEIKEQLAQLLHTFDIQVGRARLHTTASDLTFKTAHQFKKLGFNQGSDILIKIAQQAPSPEEPVAPAEIGPEAAPTEQPQAQTQLEEAGIPEEQESPGPQDNMFGKQFTLDDAVSKLDEVSNMLADREVIRMLSEFDIILDSLGIASMFPELAEAQSKLIDGYSYALTRVTKMMGMVGSGRTISELAKAKQESMEAKSEALAEKELNRGKEEGEEQPQTQKEFGAQEAKPSAAPAQAPATPQ